MHFKAENLRIPKHPNTFIPSSKFGGAMALQNKVTFFVGHPVVHKSPQNIMLQKVPFWVFLPHTSGGHHSVDPANLDFNFRRNKIIWDILFIMPLFFL